MKYKENEFLNIINSPLCKTKSITRYSGTLQNKRETLSDHIVDVCMISYYVARKLINLGVEVDMGLLLQKCIIHDMDEVLIGDIPRMTKYSSKECHDILNELADKTANEMSKSIDKTDYTYNIWKNDKDNTIEGAILTLADMLSVANKVVYEIEYQHNIGFLKIAIEIDNYLNDTHDKIHKALPDNKLVTEYIDSVIKGARIIMSDIVKENNDKIVKYDIYDDFSENIIRKRDKE